MFRNIFVSVCILCFLVACGTPTWMKYENDYFVIQYPEGWKLVDASTYLAAQSLPSENLAVTLLKKLDTKVISILVHYEKPSNQHGWETIRDTFVTQIAKEPGFTEISREEPSLENLSAFKIRYNLTPDPKKSDGKVEYIQGLIYTGNTSYFVTATTKGSFTEEEATEIMGIISSMSIKKP